MSAIRHGTKTLRVALVAAALLGGVACGGGSSPTSSEVAAPAAPAVDVDRFAKLARKIQATPARGEAILKEAGVTRAELEAAMLAIAADPALSAAYEQALRAP